ncbi:MAG: aminopeptidase [Lachnospiraceae bacterium]|nr:aminopeptidase [Lachnospiraceae bacterium]
MDYRDIFKEDNELAQERYELVTERIRDIVTEKVLPDKLQKYFKMVSEFIIFVADLFEDVKSGAVKDYSLEKCQSVNQRLNGDVLKENYETSFANPAYAVNCFGMEEGQLLAFLYTEIRAIKSYAYEYRLLELTSVLELFVQIYNIYEQAQTDKTSKEALYGELKEAVYYYMSDYCDVKMPYRVRAMVDPSLTFARDIIMNSDLTDMRYLYAYGVYVTENEIKTAQFLNSLPQEDINKMADTYTEGYRRGFENAGIDLSKKKTVDIRFEIGFERVIRQAILNFEKLGLKPVIRYSGAILNVQYDFDHRFDEALYIDKPFIERKLAMLKVAYENYKAEAAVYAGPAVLETFGEEPQNLVSKPESTSLNDKQRGLSLSYISEASRIVNEYIKGDERSFTIISFPSPQIGENFEEIFRETIKINTLDYVMYKEIQQKLIDTLDSSVQAHILGSNGNRTDLTVCFGELADATKQTNFENCLSDVNIPLGEVFTSPRLKGTNGILHISQIFIDQIEYKNLWLRFENGIVADYGCSVFEDEEANRKLIQDNLLFNHKTLPMGEFAIGTNTVAYAMAKKYDIISRLKILIIEKMGPHFAIGDTCYSHAEDLKVYNPDGKEIVARENDFSRLRDSEPQKAYFNCHTDITIPYDELKGIWAVKADGSRTPIILDGRFVLPGTESLNEAIESVD